MRVRLRYRNAAADRNGDLDDRRGNNERDWGELKPKL